MDGGHSADLLLALRLGSPIPSQVHRSGHAKRAVTRDSERGIRRGGHYEEQALASLIMHIAMIKVWNGLNVTTKQVEGEWTGQYKWRTESRLVVEEA